jgi:hypothetical protein
VSDISDDRSFEILTDPETVVASVVAPVSEEELEAMEAAVTETAEVEGVEEAGAPEAIEDEGAVRPEGEPAGEGEAEASE